MANRPPGGNRPDLIVASHPGTELPCTKLTFYLGEAFYNLVHSGALHGILLDHVGDERFYEFETMVLLVLTTQNSFD